MTLTDEQRAQRLGKVTSSIAAGALGEHPHCTPLQAWLQATGREVFEGNKDTERGELLEEPVLEYPRVALGLGREPANWREGVIAPWAGDSADCIYWSDDTFYIGEGKTAIGWMKDEYGDEGTDEVPVHYAIQAWWHLMHWPEAHACLMPVLLSDPFHFHHYIIPRDESLEGWLFESLAKWHRDYVVTDTPPPASAGDSETMRKLYPRSRGEMMQEPPDELARLAAKKLEAAARKKAAEEEEEAAKNRIKQILKAADGAELGPYRLTYRAPRPSPKVRWRDLAVSLGADEDLIRSFTYMKQDSRRLTVSEIKGKK